MLQLVALITAGQHFLWRRRAENWNLTAADKRTIQSPPGILFFFLNNLPLPDDLDGNLHIIIIIIFFYVYLI